MILRISRKLEQVLDHIGCPSCVEYSINSDIRSRDRIRSCGRVPDYFGGRPKPDPTGTRPDSDIRYRNLSCTRTLLLIMKSKIYLNWIINFFILFNKKIFKSSVVTLGKVDPSINFRPKYQIAPGFEQDLSRPIPEIWSISYRYRKLFIQIKRQYWPDSWSTNDE